MADEVEAEPVETALEQELEAAKTRIETIEAQIQPDPLPTGREVASFVVDYAHAHLNGMILDTAPLKEAMTLFVERRNHAGA